MANRDYKWLKALDRYVVEYFGTITIGATGAPTISTTDPNPSLGIKTIVRNSAGNYTVTFGDNVTGGVTDTFNSLRFFDVLIQSAAVQDFTFMLLNSGTAPSSGTVNFVCMTAGVATDLANPTTVYLRATFKNSSVK